MKQCSIFLFFFSILIAGVAFPLLAAQHTAGSPPQWLGGEMRGYYLQHFNYSMEHSAPNTPYSWKANGAQGIITAAAVFTSKTEAQCRSFSESFAIAEHTGTDKGIACKRSGAGGWCRLKEGDALTCALETPQSDMDKLWGKTKGWLR